MDECFDQSNKVRPLSLPLFFALGSKSEHVHVSVHLCCNNTLGWECGETAKGIAEKTEAALVDSIQLVSHYSRLICAPNNGEVILN